MSPLGADHGDGTLVVCENGIVPLTFGLELTQLLEKIQSAVATRTRRSLRGIRTCPVPPNRSSDQRSSSSSTNLCSTGRMSLPTPHHGLPHLVYGTAWKTTPTTALVVQAVLAGFTGIDTACQPKVRSSELCPRGG